MVTSNHIHFLVIDGGGRDVTGVGNKNFFEGIKENSAFGQRAARLRDREIFIVFVKRRLFKIAILHPKIMF